MMDLKSSFVPKIDPYHTMIKVFGTGGSGNNTINHLVKKDAKEIEKVAVNTDAQNLIKTEADQKILIGKSITGGLGAGGDPEIGERAAEESKEIINNALEGTDLLFLTCGLGGGTGTGSAPIIGRLARDKGILTIAIATMPFKEEGIIRWENAQIGLEKLKKSVDTLILLRNDKLLDLYPDLPLSDALLEGDSILINALTGLSSMVLKKGIINLDFADISMVMRDGPNAVIGLGKSSSDNRCIDAVERAVTHPMMEIDISGAQSALIHISGGPDMTLKEAREIIKVVGEKLDPNARIIWGATIEKDFRQTIQVMLIVSGLVEKELKKEKVETFAGVNSFDETDFGFESTDRPTHKIKNNKNIFDIKDSIMSSGSQVSTTTAKAKAVTQSSLVFYKIFEEEATGDLQRFDRAMHFLRRNQDNRKSLLDARQSVKLLLASAQMFGFDEIARLLITIEEILACVQSREMKLNNKIIDSITLAMEMVVDLVDNRTDGKGETGYIVNRLRELKQEQLDSLP